MRLRRSLCQSSAQNRVNGRKQQRAVTWQRLMGAQVWLVSSEQELDCLMNITGMLRKLAKCSDVDKLRNGRTFWPHTYLYSLLYTHTHNFCYLLADIYINSDASVTLVSTDPSGSRWPGVSGWESTCSITLLLLGEKKTGAGQLNHSDLCVQSPFTLFSTWIWTDHCSQDFCTLVDVTACPV